MCPPLTAETGASLDMELLPFLGSKATLGWKVRPLVLDKAEACIDAVPLVLGTKD